MTGRSFFPRAFGLATLMLVWALGPAANAGRKVIPPGHERTIQRVVTKALAPAELSIAPQIMIDRDHIVVITSPTGPLFWLFHPSVDPPRALGPIAAPAVVLRCGSKETPRECTDAERSLWTPIADRLARGRDDVADEVWPAEETSLVSGPNARGAWSWIEPLVTGLAALGGFAIGIGELRRQWSRRTGLDVIVRVSVVAALSAALVLGAVYATTMMPLHEHNTFLARSDCAIDPTCARDPVAAWSMTTFNVYGWILRLAPAYSVATLGRVSLGCSVVVLVLVHAVTRRLLTRIARPDEADWGAAAAAAALALDPVSWRLAGSGTFWPYSCACVLAAAWLGLWASDEERPAGAELGWVLGAVFLALSCGGNLVLLTLGPLLLTPVVWSQRRHPGGARLLAAAMGLGVFALLVLDDYALGFATAFRDRSLSMDLTFSGFARGLVPWRFNSSIVTPVWGVVMLGAIPLAVSSGARGLRALTPVAYAWLVPAGFLGIAAGPPINTSYPVAFINHHWEWVLSAVAVGLGAAWLVGRIHCSRGSAADGRVGGLVVAGLAVLGLATHRTADEGVRLADETRVVERELGEISSKLPSLPEHDVLVTCRRLLESLGGLPRQGDPIEVHFPRGEYLRVLDDRGLGAPSIVDTRMAEGLDPNSRVLIYVGSCLRSFQPHEIAADLVPANLERDDLGRLRERFDLEPVAVFDLETKQPDAVHVRLGADQVARVELGFYWLRRR